MEETIFDACAEACDGVGNGIIGPEEQVEEARYMARDVIQAIIARTPSPATVVELTRILREGGVDVPEATFD